MLKLSDSTAGGSEFQTVGPATEKARGCPSYFQSLTLNLDSYTRQRLDTFTDNSNELAQVNCRQLKITQGRYRDKSIGRQGLKTSFTLLQCCC